MSAMKQSLHLRLGQQLTMTPQLQQAIRLLQLSTLDLQLEIQQALESNLMLELAEDAELQSASEEDPQSAETESAAEEQPDPESEAMNLEERDGLGEELAMDTAWDDIYDGGTAYSARDPDDDRDPLENQTGGGESLQEYLLWQAGLSGFSPREAAIAEAIIDAVRDDGYLDCGLDDIQAALPSEWQVDLPEIEAVLRQVQLLDPVGVAARDPREALAVQLSQLPEDTPWLEPARRLVADHLELLANRQYTQLRRRMKLEEDELSQVVALLQTLDPHPGTRISNSQPEYVVPDVFVHRHHGDWLVEINPDAYPRLRVNGAYAGMVRRADSSRDNSVMRQHLQEARWLIKSLRSRNETLLKVARCIVERQRDFLERGDEGMQPLVLREVAERIEMHESTVSRITNQKYMHTPRGTFEFKYFFSSHVQTVDGGECSATAIRARIRRLLAQEHPSRPLSDNQLAAELQSQGINVARRTVAKYREAMGIASSTERKRLS